MSSSITKGRLRPSAWQTVAGVMLFAFAGVVQATPPVVKTVPWLSADPLVEHYTWSGKQITLKGTADVQGPEIQFEWDFGDGSAPLVGTVVNRYAIEATHAYTGELGEVYTAQLTVTNTTTGESGSADYYVRIYPQQLGVEVNVAIDAGLWYLHKTMQRFESGGQDLGDWLQATSCGTLCASSGNYAITAANLNAFFVLGHLETEDASNPYTETVQRGMRRLFQLLITEAISTQTNGTGIVDPDSNGNGYGVRVNQSNYPYQGGMFMDAIIASGTPDAVTTTGLAASGDNPGILGRTYADIVQDMVDSYAFGQYDLGSNRGGWRYAWNQAPDNSACQWAAIGLIPAERRWGSIVPDWVKIENEVWLGYSCDLTGRCGYTSAGYFPWGAYATTPSGTVQYAMDGIGRGDARWDASETFLRDTFCNTGGPTVAIRDYYYGLFSFVKSMLFHDEDGDGVDDPILSWLGRLLESQTPGVEPIDWYLAEISRGDECDGVARTLVTDQSPAGYWYAHNVDGRQYPFETAWAIMMFTSITDIPPEALPEGIPNPNLANEVTILDGSASYHLNPAKMVDSWEWDIGCDGSFELSGVRVERIFPAEGEYCVTLRVSDNGPSLDPPEDELFDATDLTVTIVPPPVPPTADAGGPYVLCPQAQPWFLDGTGSVNPDEGLSEPGAPGDTIQAYAWDLDNDGEYDDAFGAQPDVTAYFEAVGASEPKIQLRVTDTTATSFPTLGGVDLSDIDSSDVLVKDAADPACACIDDLRARPKGKKVQLVWTDTGADHYNVYRGTTAGGPYGFIGATTSRYSTYFDDDVTRGETYYYVVREAALNEDELCQSNEARATLRGRIR